MKKFHLVSYHSMESSIIGGLRIRKLFEYLTNKGMECELITQQSSKVDETSIGYNPFVNRFKGIFNFLLPVDISTAWAYRVFKHLKRNDPGIVITSSPPNGVHWVGYLLKRFSSSFYWIMDFRDPWTLNVSYKKSLKERRYYHKLLSDPWFEKLFLKKADLVLFNSDFDSEHHEKMYPFIETKNIVVRNGYDILIDDRKEVSGFKIVYAGSAYGIAEMISFLEKLNQLKPLERITCDFYGESHPLLSTTTFINYKGKFPSSELPDILAHYSHGLAFMPLEAVNSGRILQKVYDYIGAGLIPIVINPSVELSKILNDLSYGLNINAGDDLAEIFTSPKTLPKTSSKEKYSRLKQFELLYSHLDKEINSKS